MNDSKEIKIRINEFLFGMLPESSTIGDIKRIGLQVYMLIMDEIDKKDIANIRTNACE